MYMKIRYDIVLKSAGLLYLVTILFNYAVSLKGDMSIGNAAGRSLRILLENPEAFALCIFLTYCGFQCLPKQK